MAIDLNELGSRLKTARELSARSLIDAELASGISAARIGLIESGQVRASGDEILILASYYDCDFRLLIDPALPAPGKNAEILFRRYGDIFSADDRRAVQEFLLLCQIEHGLAKSLQRTSKSFSVTLKGTNYKFHGEQAASQLRSLLKYGANEVPRDIYSDFREIGLHIFRRRLANPEISGLYIEDAIAGHCVLVNYNDDVYRQRFSAAHEVAHALFDSSENARVSFETGSSKYSREDLREIRANSFASHYLMPLTVLKQRVPADVNSAAALAQQLRVSTAALAKALKDAGYVEGDFVRQIRSGRVAKGEKVDPEAASHLSALQRQRRLALLERGFSDYYVGLCFEAHYNGLISTGRLVECLRVELAELADFAALYGRSIRHDV